MAWRLARVRGSGSIASSATVRRWARSVSSRIMSSLKAEFGSATDVLIFRIAVVRGKKINLLSIFPSEDEVLLYPGMRFKVSRVAYVGSDGYTYVDLEEEAPMLVF